VEANSRNVEQDTTTTAKQAAFQDAMRKLCEDHNEASASEPGDAAASPGSCLVFPFRASLGQWLDRPL
jgi:hypothetical protein